jgi:hypothetical protein
MIGTLLGWALGLGNLIARIARGIFDWVTSDWRHAAITMLGAICAVQLIWIEPALRDRIADRTAERDTARQERDDERAAHRQTKTDYREAQDEAARKEQLRLDRVKAEQQEITDAVEADYRRQLAGLHARAERLREELRAGAGAAGAGRGVEVPGLPVAGGGSAEATGDHGFPAAFDRDPAEQLERDVIATEQAIQLNALIDWLLKQHAIDPNADLTAAAGPQ